MEGHKVRIETDEKVKKYYAQGVGGGFTNYDFRLAFLDLDRIDVKKKEIVQKILFEVIMSPIAAKQLSEWLKKQVDVYEKHYGKIETQKAKREEIGLEGLAMFR